MVKDAEANKEADKQKRETVETRNQADTLVHSTEKTLKEHGDKLSVEDKKKVEDDLTSLKEALKSENTQDINDKIKSLTESAMKLGEAVYKDQQQQENENASNDTKNNDNVVDADFEEVKK